MATITSRIREHVESELLMTIENSINEQFHKDILEVAKKLAVKHKISNQEILRLMKDAVWNYSEYFYVTIFQELMKIQQLTIDEKE
jgi:precorrin-3B methylase